MKSRNALRALPLLMALAAAAVIAGAPQTSDAAWDGRHDIRLGDRVTAEFRGTPLSETHEYAFHAPADTIWTARITVDADADGLVPELRLFTRDGTPMDLGPALVGNKVRNFRFLASGDYVLRVRATAGTGTYHLRTKARFPRRLTGVVTAEVFTFDSVAGTRVTGRARPARNSTARPKFTTLSSTSGAVSLGSGAGTPQFTRVRLPADATYSLGIDPGTAGQAVAVTLTFAPPAPREWSLGFVEDTEGLATENRAKWLTSAHADHSAAAFNNWNDTDPPAIPTTCARCHSTPGYRDWLGADGTAAGVVDKPAPIGSVIECNACHNDAAEALTAVTFPSGLTVTGLGAEARCMVCHQGRESTVSMETKIKTAAAADDDTVSSKLSFLNVHYFAAGASFYGREAAGAYEYALPGGDASDAILAALPQRRPYDRKFTHVAQKDTCIECHDPHSQKVRVEDCASCHVDAAGNPVADYAALRDIRMDGTINDFDGDGDAREGIAHEIEGLQATLYKAMQDYAANSAGQPIAYDGGAYPYFFQAGTASKYTAWTNRLLRAAYNYQYVAKDPGAFAHNGKYIVQILYDSISDLNDRLATLPGPLPVANFANLHRNDEGHFNSLAEPYRHWDEDTDHLVDPSCARCHSIEGFQFAVKYGIDTTVPAPLASGLSCETCHVEGTNFAPRAQNPNADRKPARLYVADVKFPYPSTATSTQIAAVTIVNGAKGTSAQDDSFLCMTCHRGRESTLTMDAAYPTPTATFTLSFKNVHYLPAGGTLYGSKAAVAYQYTGKVYAQRWDHDQSYFSPYPAPANARAKCEFCHMQEGSHSFEPEISTACTFCHVNSTNFDDLTPAFRLQSNYDNDAATKPKAEFKAFQARLLAAIQKYSRDAQIAGVNGAEWINYDGLAYPYFFKDSNRNGAIDPTEKTAAKFDSKGVRASFNYQYAQKEPGAWAHNPKYILQVLYDSIQDLNGDLTGLTRPN